MNRDTHNGFTLLELIVAIAIFSVLAAMAYSGLNQVLNSRQATEQSADKLIALQRTFLFLARDIQQVINRPIRDGLGQIEPPFFGAFSGIYLMQFTRTGWRNPAQAPRSSLQRVAWGLEDEVLKRVYWTTLDRAQDDEPVEQAMLDEVTGVEVRYLDKKNNWHTDWPQTIQSNGEPADSSPPRAVEITVEHKEFGKIVRLFAVPG